MSATDRQRSALMTQIGPVITELGFELDDVAVSRVGRRALVRIVVDSDAGIDLDGIADVSRAVGSALDRDDPFDTPFVLEVTSPGVERPLTEPRHWRRNLSRLVEVMIGADPVTGRIAVVDDDGVALETETSVRRASWGELGPGRVQVEFGRRRGTPARPDESAGDDESTVNDEEG